MLRPAISCLALGIATLAAAQQPDTVSQPLKTGISAVVIDVVVRDGKGRPVTDLRKEDFQLLEDGVEQQIGDVTVAGVVDRDGARDARSDEAQTATVSKPNAGSAARTDTAPAGADFLAIVFDRLTPDARALAYRGALAAVDTLRDGDFVGIFVSNLTLETVQGYTNDRDRIRKGIRDAAMRATAAFDRASMRHKENDRIGDVLPGDAHPSVPDVASPESEGRPVDGRTSLLRLMGSLQTRTHASWEVMSRDYQGYATTNALVAVTSALGMLPGRKTVIFFAEALAIPDAVLPHFRDVVTTANRGNVSVYSIDTAGLRVHSQDAATAREVTAMAALGTHLNPDGSNSSSLAVLERNEDVLRKDPRTSLSLLAEQTGGFFIENTNDLAAGFRRVDADRRFHYLLTYTPRNGESDGTWRSVAVKVPSRDVTVRARSGYLAVRSGSALPVLAYEGAALAALERSPAPADLPVRAGAFVFPGTSGPRVVLLAATDARAVRVDRGADGGYRTDFTILARVLDEQGRVVRKSSQPYRLVGPPQQEEQARSGEVLFYRQPVLAPGRYTLETVVHDALAGSSAVLRAPFDVPATAPGGLKVSSLVLVRRAEQVRPEERQPDNPLFVGEALVYPNLGEPVRKSQQKALTFLIAMQAGKGGAPAATMEVVQGGKAVVSGPIALPPPDAAGRIDHVLQIASDALPAGRYTFRLTVVQGDHREVREAQILLVE